MKRALLVLATSVALLGCGDDTTEVLDASMPATDSGAGVDAGQGVDAASMADAGSSVDVGPRPTGAFVEIAGIVSMETENHDDDVGGGWQQEAHADASGGLFMRAQLRRDPDARIEFAVRFEMTGRYEVYLRSNSTSDDDNDCYVLLDGAFGQLMTDSGWTEVSGIKTNNRSWGAWDSQAKSEADIPVAIRRRGTHIAVTSAGEHVFALGSRSIDFQVDKIVLVHESLDFEPTGLGPPETRQ